MAGLADDWSGIFYRLSAGEIGRSWTYEDIGKLSLPQLRNELYRGKDVAPVGKVGVAGALKVLADFKAGKFGGNRSNASPG